MKITNRIILSAVCVAAALFANSAFGQPARPSKSDQGSQTARNGFKNETQIAHKFNNWKNDADAQNWLAAMGYPLMEISAINAFKPNGEKADVVVKIRTSKEEFSEGISIKLVSSPSGYNQIDKRWLTSYASKWRMPKDVSDALKLFVGEAPPVGKTRRPERMFLTEMEKQTQAKVVEFFEANKKEIISDILAGDGFGGATWLMVIWKPAGNQKWTLRNIEEAANFFGEGDVAITRSGNLKIGRITMQRKGGDAGRQTAKMLQFKMNPALLFELE